MTRAIARALAVGRETKRGERKERWDSAGTMETDVIAIPGVDSL